jgi:hypothetical protein
VCRGGGTFTVVLLGKCVCGGNGDLGVHSFKSHLSYQAFAKELSSINQALLCTLIG